MEILPDNGTGKPDLPDRIVGSVEAICGICTTGLGEYEEAYETVDNLIYSGNSRKYV